MTRQSVHLCEETLVLDFRQLEGQQGCGIQVDALPAHRQVQMRSGSATGASAQPDFLTALDPLPCFTLISDRWR